MKRTATLAGVLMITFLNLVRADWRIEASTGAVYNSNLSNSDRDEDVRDDWAWRSFVGIADGLQLTRDLRLNLSADLRSEVWARFSDFNTIGPGASAAVRYRFGLGRLAPWLLFEERFGYDRVEDSPQSGYDNLTSISGGFALSERLALEASYAFDNFVAPDTFYDRQNHHVTLRAIADVTSSLQIALGYHYDEGDVISYAVPPRPDIAAFAIKRENEDEFGDPLRTAYKLLGRTNGVSVSAALQLTKYASVQVEYEYAVTRHEPLVYDNHLVQARIAFAY